MKITITNEDAVFTVKKIDPNYDQYGLYILNWKIHDWYEEPTKEEVEAIVAIIIRSWAVLSTEAILDVDLAPSNLMNIQYLR